MGNGFLLPLKYQHTEENLREQMLTPALERFINRYIDDNNWYS